MPAGKIQQTTRLFNKMINLCNADNSYIYVCLVPEREGDGEPHHLFQLVAAGDVVGRLEG